VSTERSDRVYEGWRTSTERFDYYVTGIAAALVAYLGQGLGPTKFEWSPAGLELVAVVLFLLAFLAGLMRIRTVHAVLQSNWAMLYASEAAGALAATRTLSHPLLNEATGEVVLPGHVAKMIAGARQGAADARKEADRTGRCAYLWGIATYWLLSLGFVGMLASKVWLGYQAGPLALSIH
jgi:hypothetical protein